MVIGRADELAELERRLDGRVASVLVGEAGVGKTALLRAAADASGADVFEGGALEMLSEIPYVPLTRALGDEPPEGDDGGVGAFVAERVGTDGLLLLDDLQWADSATLAAVPFIADRVGVIAAVRRGDPATPAVLAGLVEAGFEPLEVEPLDPETAANLVRDARPQLGDDEVDRLVQLAHGNPLLLLELGAGGEISETLEISLAARLRTHSRGAREALARLALLGRPAAAELLGVGAAELLESGLALDSPEGVEIRHALLADAVVEELTDDERRGLHTALAQQLADPGEAARHHAAAGENAAAHEQALEAATRASRPGQRAALLALAAETAVGIEAVRLRLEAAGGLLDAGDPQRAHDLVESLAVDDAALEAQRQLRLGCALAGLGRAEEAEERLAEARGLARGTDRALEARILVDWARTRLFHEWGSAAALELAGDAYAAAKRFDVAPAEAAWVIACAEYVSGAPACLEHCREAVASARAGGDPRQEGLAALLLAGAEAVFGDPAESDRIARRTVERARELRLRGLEAEGLILVLEATVAQRGDYPEALRLGERLLAEPRLLGASLYEVIVRYALALIDTGRIEEARKRLLEALEQASTDVARQAFVWALAEAEWTGGSDREAAKLAEQAWELDTDSPNALFILPVRSWAELGCGETPDPPESTTGFGAATGAAQEARAIAMLAEPGAADEAVDRFLAACPRYRGVDLRCELRCLWGAGEAAVRAGQFERARELLLQVEARAQEHGIVWLTTRARRSLRSAGVHRSAPRAAGRRLSGREREVMGLVAEGLTSAQIAARLGIARSTVDSQVKSAMGKLEAKTRRQAALIAVAEGDEA